ncbi:MAG: glycoside hydrolase family 1 protein [Chthoniobacterales bacterium]
MPKPPSQAQLSEGTKTFSATKKMPSDSEDFMWGVSVSSYQYENPDVRKGEADYFETDWDYFVEEGKAPRKGNALDSWTHFDKDLAALKKIGAKFYRFNVSWARVEPRPGVFNETAIRGYVRMARQLKEAGIEPIVCLWHFTFPGWLYDKKNPVRSNWLHPEVQEYWEGYLDKIIPAMAPYTKYFAPQNEPNGQITTAYLVGQWPPGILLSTKRYWQAIEASTTMYNEAARKVHELVPGGKVIAIVALPWWERSVLDVTGYFYRSLLHTNYDHLDRVVASTDMIGINYYYSQVVGVFAYATLNSRRGNHYSMMGWRINPDGLYKQIQTISARYGKPMLITENGVATRKDEKRIEYMNSHLKAIARALRDGYDVRGYLTWSLADNYEWHYGYDATFGLSHMEPETLDRKLKLSAYWYRDIMEKYSSRAAFKKFGSGAKAH